MRREQNTPPSLVQAYLISHCSTTSRINRAKSFSATQSLKSTGNNIGVCRSITTYRSGIHSFTRSVPHFKVRQVPTGHQSPITSHGLPQSGILNQAQLFALQRCHWIRAIIRGIERTGTMIAGETNTAEGCCTASSGGWPVPINDSRSDATPKDLKIFFR